MIPSFILFFSVLLLLLCGLAPARIISAPCIKKNNKIKDRRKARDGRTFALDKPVLIFFISIQIGIYADTVRKISCCCWKCWAEGELVDKIKTNESFLSECQLCVCLGVFTSAGGHGNFSTLFRGRGDFSVPASFVFGCRCCCSSALSHAYRRHLLSNW